MTHGDEHVRNNAGENQADEKTGSAPKPKTRTVNGVTIIDTTHRGRGFAIGGVNGKRI